MIRALALVLCISFTSDVRADEREVRGKIREQSWTVVVRNPSGQFQAKGSCTVFADSKGQTWALSCCHVIASAIEDQTQSVSISKPVVEDFFRVGVTEYKAEIVKACSDDDLVLMKIQKAGIGKPMAWGSVKPLPLDTVVLHCGTFFGVYDQRISKGTIQGHNWQMRSGSVYCDAGDFIIHPGSSGGGVFTETGELVGVCAWKHSDDCSFFVPMRTVTKFLDGTDAWESPVKKVGSLEVLAMPKEKTTK